MLIKKQPDLIGTMRGKTVLITGAGGGIGLEAAKTFAYMGARTIIAEIDKTKGIEAEQSINDLFADNFAEFYQVDLSDKSEIYKMCNYIDEKYGCPDVVFNNATITKMGAVEDVSLDFWEKSYAVNFRAPLMLSQIFLPKMKERNSGIIVFVSSSGASPYMGAYEVFKTSQVELCNTLAMELEGTNIYTYTIGPGLVKTQTAMDAIQIVASKMNMTTEEFYKMNSRHIIDAESAGVGFALSVLKAPSYCGQEIGSIQVLMDFKLIQDDKQIKDSAVSNQNKEIPLYFQKIFTTYADQYDGWRSMNIFEKQWVLRDFKKCMAFSAEQAFEKLKAINTEIQNGNYQILSVERAFLEKLRDYWGHQLKLLKGYEKNPEKLKENSLVIEGWISDIEKVICI